MPGPHETTPQLASTIPLVTVPARLVAPLVVTVRGRFATVCERLAASALDPQGLADSELLSALSAYRSLLLALESARPGKPATLALEPRGADALIASLHELNAAPAREPHADGGRSGPSTEEDRPNTAEDVARLLCAVAADAETPAAPRDAAIPGGETDLDAGGTLASRLTPREAEVLAALSAAKGYGQIAAELHIDLETVRTHARHVRRKLGVRSSRELVGRLGVSPRHATDDTRET